MLILPIKKCKSILCKNIPEDWAFITDSEDIESICKDIGLTNALLSHRTWIKRIDDIGSMFVDLTHGEINTVAVHIQSVPYLHYAYTVIFERYKKVAY